MVKLCMDFNVFFLMCVLQVKCDKGREGSSYQVYIELVTFMYKFSFFL
jgi:hypothetical protein